jgi:benzoyl-CoA reductase/2-hydroxyglutaryl-CoA dehydratase subunit BcrC/BadD/HgdB
MPDKKTDEVIMVENNSMEPLISDQFAGEPSKRALSYIQSKREEGRHIIGTYCGFAPLELFRAMGAVPAVLCAFSNKTIGVSESVLPSNLCPLIKSSYGFIISDTCPFFALSEAVVAETTCDGKKKMFELIADKKPMYVMDLPQMPDNSDARKNWARIIRNLQAFFEDTFAVRIDDSAIESEIRDSNMKNRLLEEIFSYAAMKPSYLKWTEIYDLTYLAQPATYADMKPILEDSLKKLETRKEKGFYIGNIDSPRVLITGCPVGGDALKVYRAVEESGGVIVAIDNCTGFKPFMGTISENTHDPVMALSERYMDLHCSCMSPNDRRLNKLDELIEKYRPDMVIDLILHGCHAYNIESFKVREHIKTKHNLPFLKIETDYSESDIKQIKTRVQALMEITE